MDRRTLVRYLSLVGASAAAAPILGCGSALAPSASGLAEGATRHVMVYDLKMEGWSTLGSGFLGYLPDPLLSTVMRDFVEVELPYTQDPHGHQFTLTEAELSRLLLGEDVSVLTTYALDHRHEVRIFPSRHFGNRAPLDVVIDEAGHPVPPTFARR